MKSIESKSNNFILLNKLFIIYICQEDDEDED